MLADCLVTDTLADTAAPGPTPEQALAAMFALSELAPTDPALHRDLAQAYRAVGQEIEARAEETAALALELGVPTMLFNLGTVYFTTGYYDAAARWYRLTIAVAPAMAAAHQNLACILFDQGHPEAGQYHRDCAYRQQCVFTAQAPQERRRVLILGASGYGNIPLRFLLPQQVNTQSTWFLEYTKPDTATALPPYDIVLNGVGDPDLDGPTFVPSCAFLSTCAKPLLNHPDRVSLTRRDRLPDLLAGIDGIEVPPVIRVGGTADHPSAPGFTFPLLVRPAASHGGEGLVRIDAASQLRAVDWDGAEAWYLSPFRDYRSADGYWRKYRVIYVDGEPYPYHLAISPHWLVHYVSADMLSEPAKCLEERRFLEQPDAMLGQAGMTAIRTIGQRLGLDYAGVDFTQLPDGRILVFEANATMLVHPETNPKLAYKNPFVTRILDAFDALLSQRIQTAQPVSP
jgi:hypothetical protein